MEPPQLVGILVKSIRTVPSIGHLWLGLSGHLIPFIPLDFVSQCQCRPKKCFHRCCAFTVVVLSNLYAVHCSTGNSLYPYCTPAWLVGCFHS